MATVFRSPHGAAVLVLAVLAAGLAACAQPPPLLPDLATVKHDLRGYHDDGEYNRQVAAITAEAEAYLAERARDAAGWRSSSISTRPRCRVGRA